MKRFSCFTIVLLYLSISFPGAEAYINNTCGGDGTFTCSSRIFYEINGGTHTYSNCRFINCGSVQFVNGAVVTLSNIIFDNCGDVKSPILFQDGTSVTATNVQFLGTHSQERGGGISVTSESAPANAVFTNVLFKFTHADIAGGAIHLKRSNLKCTNCIFDYPTAGGSGGAIQMDNSAHAVIDGGYCKNAVAPKGGCYSLLSQNVLNVSNHVFENITSTEQASMAIADNGDTIYMENIYANNLKAGKAPAGVIYQNSFGQYLCILLS